MICAKKKTKLVGQSGYNFNPFESPCMPEQPESEASLITHCWHTFMFVMEFASRTADLQKSSKDSTYE